MPIWKAVSNGYFRDTLCLCVQKGDGGVAPVSWAGCDSWLRVDIKSFHPEVKASTLVKQFQRHSHFNLKIKRVLLAVAQRSSQPVNPTKPAPPRPLKPTKILKHVKPVNHMEPLKPVNVMKPLKPVNLKKPLKPVNPTKPLKPMNPTKPLKPANHRILFGNH